MRFLWRAAIAALVPTAAFVAFGACGPNPTAVESCRQIEEARCRRAPGCGLPLAPPEHKDGSDIDSCIRFYHDACLHGMATSNEPGDVLVRDCVNAITTGDCKVVKDPTQAPACGFLVPKPADNPEASPADAATDGG
jgi:hypothetical protein